MINLSHGPHGVQNIGAILLQFWILHQGWLFWCILTYHKTLKKIQPYALKKLSVLLVWNEKVNEKWT